MPPMRVVEKPKDSSETEYLLERFGFEDPKRLYTAKSILREIEMDKAATAYKEMTMKELRGANIIK